MFIKVLVVSFGSLILICGLDPKNGALRFPPENEQQSSVKSSEALAEADRLNAQVIKLFGQQKYDEALQIAQQVLKIRETHLDSDDESIAAAVLNLGEISHLKRKYEEAERLFERALRFYEKKFGTDDASVARVLDRLTVVYFDRWKFSESREAAERALAINEKIFGAESMEVANSLHRIAEFYRFRNPDKAEPYYDRALIIVVKNLPRENPLRSKLVEDYSCLYYETDQMEKLKGLGQKYWPEQQQKNSEDRGSVLNGRTITLPKPNFPRELWATNVSGRVIVKVWIDETGKVIDARDMCGAHPTLAKAALAAAHKAQFPPTKLSGQPAKVHGIITYNFVRN